MPITDHCKIQIVYNTGRRQPCGGQFFTPHTVRRCPASLSHRANDRWMCYRFFNFWSWGLPLGQRSPKGRWPTIHRDVPFYKISARSRKRCSRYALPKFFTLWRWFLTYQGHPRSNLTVPIESPWVLHISAPGGSNLVSVTVFEIWVKILTLTFWPWSG